MVIICVWACALWIKVNCCELMMTAWAPHLTDVCSTNSNFLFLAHAAINLASRSLTLYPWEGKSLLNQERIIQSHFDCQLEQSKKCSARLTKRQSEAIRASATNRWHDLQLATCQDFAVPWMFLCQQEKLWRPDSCLWLKKMGADFAFNLTCLTECVISNTTSAVSYTHLTLPTNREV